MQEEADLPQGVQGLLIDFVGYVSMTVYMLGVAQNQ